LTERAEEIVEPEIDPRSETGGDDGRFTGDGLGDSAAGSGEAVADAAPARGLSSMLQAIVADGSRERIAISDLLAIMDDRAIAALMFVFAVPNVLPTPPGTSSVLGAPLLFLSLQLMLGLPPWLPRVIAARSIPRKDLAAIVARIAPWLAKAERLLRPRLHRFVAPPAEYVVGTVCFLLAVLLFLPIPLGNMLPALAICVMALAVLEQDGLWVLLGFATAGVSVAVVWGVLYTLVMTAIHVISSFLPV